MRIFIVGAGIAGTSCAIALTKWMQAPPDITILEIRSKPQTIGGAIGLTPNAVRALHHLDVLKHIQERQLGNWVDSIQLFNLYTASSLGAISFTGPDGNGIGDPPFRGLRILRSELLDALIQTVKALPNVSIRFGSDITTVTEYAEGVTIGFANGSQVTSDVVVGADGIHSIIRSLHVEPDRKPTYTGIAGISGFSQVPDHVHLRWEDTGLCQSISGSLLCSYFEPSRTKQFLGAVMETEDMKSKEGWFAVGREQEVLKQRIKTAYLGSNVKMPGITKLVEASQGWSLWPVYMLPPKGKWSTKRTILVGDAAHAVRTYYRNHKQQPLTCKQMPPQGESAGIALEDSIILGRTLSRLRDSSEESIGTCFAAYERLRRPRVDEAHVQSTWGWSTQKDSGWLMFQFRCWLTWIFLPWTAKSRAKHHAEALATKDLGLD
jgi:salicylate hydroxylase